MPALRSNRPWPCFFQQWNLASPRLTEPEQYTLLFGVMTPFSSAARATTILKVEPGAYWPAIALLMSGDFGLADSPCHSSGVSPRLKALGSKPGTETMARTSPVWTSRTTTEALSSPSRRATSS
jgi:hypothetical protein